MICARIFICMNEDEELGWHYNGYRRNEIEIEEKLKT